ncbi:hypothetical protein DFH09DRAFT_1131246 [Mycena vulgaris]|nr:hypothetical protein DFH09DRAFT_1131246 [Mycena vulgaris]
MSMKCRWEPILPIDHRAGGSSLGFSALAALAVAPRLRLRRSATNPVKAHESVVSLYGRLSRRACSSSAGASSSGPELWSSPASFQSIHLPLDAPRRLCFASAPSLGEKRDAPSHGEPSCARALLPSSARWPPISVFPRSFLFVSGASQRCNSFGGTRYGLSANVAVT